MKDIEEKMKRKSQQQLLRAFKTKATAQHLGVGANKVVNSNIKPVPRDFNITDYANRGTFYQRTQISSQSLTRDSNVPSYVPSKDSNGIVSLAPGPKMYNLNDNENGATYKKPTMPTPKPTNSNILAK